MTDDEQPVLPDDSIEDLAPGEESEQVSGGAFNAYLKIDGITGESQDIKTSGKY